MLKRIEFLPADVLGLSPLAAAARSGRALPAGLALPRRWEAVEAPRDALDRDQRAHLARWLEARSTPLGVHVRTLEAVRSLARPGASCVLCRVAPGFLGSPLSGLHDALACLHAARELARRSSAPVVPIAWLRADEGLGAELTQTWIPNRNHELQRVGLPTSGAAPLPTADAPLDEERHRLPALRAMLAQLHGDHPHAELAVELLVPRGGESLATATGRALLQLLGPLGLVVVDPDWLRDESSRALARVVARDPVPELRRTERELAAAGLAPELSVEGAPLVLREESSRRRALRAGGEGFRYDGEPGSRTPAELAAEIVQEPKRWSAGPLLAPLVAEGALPVAAHVGSASELAVHALLAGLRARVDAPPVPFLLRSGATWIDEESARALERLELSPARALALRGDAVGEGETEPVAAPPVVVELRAIADAALREMLERRPELARIEPSLPGQLERATSQARGALERVCGKAERVAADRGGRGRRHARRVRTVLLPHDRAQEQVLGPFPFFARYGTEWLEELAREWDPLGAEHLAVFLGSEQRN